MSTHTSGTSPGNGGDPSFRVSAAAFRQGTYDSAPRELRRDRVFAEAAPGAGEISAGHARHIVVTGASGTLGRAFGRVCRARGFSYRLLSRKEMDIADAASVEEAIERYQPSAIINTCGYVRVDEAENDRERCFRENTLGPAILAAACVRHRLQFMTFSTDLVFDGRKGVPYLETDSVAPLNVYGMSKAEAERKVLESCPSACVVRTSAFFGPWDTANFLNHALTALAAGQPFAAAADVTVSPTYVPDLVQRCLSLLLDGESGIWHLTNFEPITWADLALRAAELAGLDASRLESVPAADLRFAAPRPRYSALQSCRAGPLPSLTDALTRYLKMREDAASARSSANGAPRIETEA